MGMGGNENSTFSHLPPRGSWSSDIVNGPLFCIVICRRQLGKVLIWISWDTACVDTACVGLFRALLSLPVICYLIELLLVVRESEREGMGITDGNGNKTRLNLGSGMGIGINHCWEWEGMGLKKTFPLTSNLDSIQLCLKVGLTPPPPDKSPRQASLDRRPWNRPPRTNASRLM